MNQAGRADPAGCHGLIFLPHLERFPGPDVNPNATGVFMGITLSTGRVTLSALSWSLWAISVRRNMEALSDMASKGRSPRVRRRPKSPA